MLVAMLFMAQGAIVSFRRERRRTLVILWLVWFHSFRAENNTIEVQWLWETYRIGRLVARSPRLTLLFASP